MPSASFQKGGCILNAKRYNRNNKGRIKMYEVVIWWVKTRIAITTRFNSEELAIQFANSACLAENVEHIWVFGPEKNTILEITNVQCSNEERNETEVGP
jgi:hypothetical protein